MIPIRNRKKTLQVTVDEMRSFSFAYVEKYAPSKQQLKTYLLKKYMKLSASDTRKNDVNNNFIAEIKYSSISKHTAELYLEFSNLESKILHSFNFVSNIYHDVELVEVASFNGYAPNKFPFPHSIISS